MKFEHARTREDGGGVLTVTAENEREVLELAKHYRKFDLTDANEILDLADLIRAGRWSHVDQGSAKRPWFLVDVGLYPTFLKPYADLLKQTTGYAGSLPDLDLTPHHPRRLCHTHHTFSCQLVNGVYAAEVCLTAEDWNDRTAAENAVTNAHDYCEEDIGHRPLEREFVPARNGNYVPNPNYLKRHKAVPQTSAPWLWEVLFGWWRNTHATAHQRAILDRCDECHRKSNLDADWKIRSNGQGAHLVGASHLVLAWDPYEFMTWERFAALGVPEELTIPF